MLFSDLALSKRLERAEGHSCAQFAEARQRLFPDSASEWRECGGAYAVFDGVDSPLTQSFGLGLFEELSDASLDTLESFFRDRGAAVVHEVSPLAGVPALNLLCQRNYRPMELSSVLFRSIGKSANANRGDVSVRAIAPEEAPLWSEISARGWSHEHPELFDFLRQFGAICTERAHCACFLAEVEGQPGAAGLLCMNEGVAVFAGSSTVPELRRRGLQAALLEERLRYAFECGCDLAMMVAEVGSNSQRNAERAGFQIAYTRTKWRLHDHPPTGESR